MRSPLPVGEGSSLHNVIPAGAKWRAGTSGDFASGDPRLAQAIGDDSALGFFYLEGFGAGRACPKGQLRLFVGDLTGQVRFAPLRGRFPKEIWT